MTQPITGEDIAMTNGASPDQRFIDQKNPFYTPSIIAAYRAYKEAEYGGHDDGEES